MIPRHPSLSAHQSRPAPPDASRRCARRDGRGDTPAARAPATSPRGMSSLIADGPDRRHVPARSGASALSAYAGALRLTTRRAVLLTAPPARRSVGSAVAALPSSKKVACQVTKTFPDQITVIFVISDDHSTVPLPFFPVRSPHESEASGAAIRSAARASGCPARCEAAVAPAGGVGDVCLTIHAGLWLASMGTAPAVRVVPVAPGLRKLRKIAEDSGRSLNGRQAFVIEREIRDCGMPETPEAERRSDP